jgi:hypothetical protein
LGGYLGDCVNDYPGDHLAGFMPPLIQSALATPSGGCTFSSG